MGTGHHTVCILAWMGAISDGGPTRLRCSSDTLDGGIDSQVMVEDNIKHSTAYSSNSSPTATFFKTIMTLLYVILKLKCQRSVLVVQTTVVNDIM